MNKGHTRFINFLAALSLSLLAAGPAAADDTELFLGQADAVVNVAQPNILFILDTSGSMGTEVTAKPLYEPGKIYPGACTPDRVYWREGPGDPPACDGDFWFNAAANMCKGANTAFDTSGFYTDRAAQYDFESDQTWEPLRTANKDRLVECSGDSGIHGDGSDEQKVYATDGNNDDPWLDDPMLGVSWSGDNTGHAYTLYSANYVNWYYDPASAATTRIDIMKDVTAGLLDSLTGVNVGLMQFNVDEGGPILHAIEDIATGREQLQATLKTLDADSWTPLSEALYEAGQYYQGRAVEYGDIGPTMSVDESRENGGSGVDSGGVIGGSGDIYQEPLTLECQKNYVVMLTDGEPTRDQSADDRIAGLPDYGNLVGAACAGNNGDCLDDMAKYLFEADLNPNLDGKQNVHTYTIGFAIDLPLLQETANKGGGQYLTADDTSSLQAALSNILREILEEDTTFVSPTVSVNAFNRTQTLADLFVAVFKPASEEHWPGNIKKYKLIDGEIVGVDEVTPVVDPRTGFFTDDSQSFWTVNPDGASVSRGGAANKIPDPAQRNVYTNVDASPASLVGFNNELDVSNANLMKLVATLPGYTADLACPSRNCDIINFARGIDVLDQDQDGDMSDPRNAMGDPLHARPVTVIYGGTDANPDITDAVIYVASNDGYIHALDPNTGAELWSFVPRELLEHLPSIFDNGATKARRYGIDGNIQSVKLDFDRDGIVEPAAGEKVLLFFGQRRGGRNLYAMDVSNKDKPVLLWQKDGDDYPGLGETWSTPIPARVDIAGSAQNALNLALIFGGGYDTSQDNAAYTTDASGNAIFIVDAMSGALLWKASKDNANLNLPKMTNSIPADVRVLDIDANGYADRIYASDTGGRVWRFDITNGNTANTLVAGGVLAALGAGDNNTDVIADNRRFYYAPDAALISTGATRFVHIGIGSGYRAHPLDTENQNRFYALRDKNVFNKLTQAEYDALTPIIDQDLVDVTLDAKAQLPANAAGWQIQLRLPGWVGEKVLAEARTFADRVFFTTFTPRKSDNPCLPGLGVNKLFVVEAEDGNPVNNLDGVGGDDDLTVEDRIWNLAQGGIAPEIVFLFPGDDACPGGDCDRVYGFVGVEGISGLQLPSYVRTYWTQEATE